MFQEATRMKLRFPFRGQATVEDLWDLDVQDLDSLYKVLSRQMRESNEESLLEDRSQGDRELELKVSIVKHIVKVKLAEREAREQRVAQAARKQKILSIIEEKQDAALYNMPLDELHALVAED